MEQNDKKVILNLGCGFRKKEGMINIDAFPNCRPDVVWDLNKTPWPWEDNSVDMVWADHIMEHLDDWWAAFKEVARILKYGGILEMSVPDYSTTLDYGYLDHKHIITKLSFHMVLGQENRGANAWARCQEQIPLLMTQYVRVVHPKYVKWWTPKWLLRFLIDHMVNFVYEQQFSFIKIKV